jgi:hypothetical protein
VPRTRDRSIGAAVGVLAAAALLAAAGAARAPLPDRVFETDPRALAALTALLDARDRGSWLVDFAFDRELASGATRHDTITQAQVPPTRVLVTAATATVDLGDRRVVCTTTDDGASCRETERDAGALPVARVYEEAVTRGVYALRAAPDRRVGGERARCFEMIAITGTIDGFGLASVHCFALDGVPLWSRVALASVVDTREARVVSRSVDRAQLARLLDPFAGSGAPDLA